jgi:integrase/recombinase XerD
VKALKETIIEELSFYIESFLRHLKDERGFSGHTLNTQRVSLSFFQKWAFNLGLYFVLKITKENMNDFEVYLFNYKKTNAEPLTFLTQRQRISAVRSFFSWLLKQGYILYNPAADLEFPKREKTLPRFILTESEAEAILNQPVIESIYGLRDRVVLEIFYSCGLRRAELLHLNVYDIDFNRKTLSVRKGKGQKDRVVPLGDRVLFWLKEYLEKSRPKILKSNETDRLFVIYTGKPMKYHQIGAIVRENMEKSGIIKRAGCHIFRHTMATHMLNNGAGIRYVQQMLGHSMLSTTQVYTKVAIEKLKDVHERSFDFAYEKPDLELEPIKGPKRKKIHEELKIKRPGNVVRYEGESEQLKTKFLEYLKIKNFAKHTIENKRTYLKRFLNWLKDENIKSFQEVTRETLQNYQKYTADFKVNDKELSAASRFYMISHVAHFFSWLSKNNHIVVNPASGLSMPKVVKSLPMNVLSSEEIEAIFSQPDLKTPEGLRDRAALELFYSSGIRLSELCNLKVSDINFENSTIFICLGKGKKDRYVPVGKRALFWVTEYVNKSRIHFIQKPTGYLFLNRFGGGYGKSLSFRIKEYMLKAGIKKAGSTILFRHSMATHMMDNNADLRYIQSILGHESMETTKIYTHVAIGKLREVHARTHPAEKNSGQIDSNKEYQ